MFLGELLSAVDLTNSLWAHDHACNDNDLAAQIVQIGVLFKLVQSFQLSGDILEDHILEIVPHQLSVRDQVLQFEFQ